MNIKEHRQSANMTQEDLAKALGVSKSLISRYENGRTQPPISMILKMSKIFGVDTNDFVVSDYIVKNDQDMLIEVHQQNKPQPLAKLKVLAQSEGKCELCGCDAPFFTNEGLPYLEVHYIVPLDDGGKITPQNMVVLCPNCNRKVAMIPNKDEESVLKEKALSHHW